MLSKKVSSRKVKKALRAECLSIECFMANKRIEGKGIVFNSLLEKGPLA